jgi:hypothetical protein
MAYEKAKHAQALIDAVAPAFSTGRLTAAAADP